jgi:ribonuclease VapC
MASDSIVVDSSAIIAILLLETGFERIERALAAADTILMSATSKLETCLVMANRSKFDNHDMSETEALLRLTIVPFSNAHAECAADAFLRFGKGRHKAALNFGDCQTYATAKLAGLPLLFVGDDFGLTDIECVQL